MDGNLMNAHAPMNPTMQVWFTAQELADAQCAGLFTGLPTTKRRINDMAEREKWSRSSALVRTETGRGGTITRYHIDLLPMHERISYVSRFISVSSADPASSLPAPGSADLTERARLTRDTKMVVLRLAERFHRDSGLTVVGADGLFVQAFNAGKVELPEWAFVEAEKDGKKDRKAVIGSLSVRTLSRWREAANKAGADALGHDPALARKGSGLLETANDGAVKRSILGWLVNNPALAAEELRDLIEDEYGDELTDRSGEMKPLPPTRTFQHFVKELKATENVVLTKITDPDGFRSTMKLRGTGSYSWVTEMNQLWMIDASPGDALCIDGRHSIYVCIDVATRDLVVTVSKTPRASAVGLMMRKAILQRGVCITVKTDNGSDFVAQESQRLFASLGIEPKRSQKFTPEEKAFVERAIKTIQHKFFSALPGYIGHSVADRKVIEGRKSFAKRLGQGPIETFEVSLTAEQLQQQLDDWLEHKYRQRKHGGLGGRTPAQVMAASITPPRTVDERALDILLMPVVGKDGFRKMTAQGIGIGTEYYLCSTILPGTELFVRQDPSDMGKVYVFSADDGRFLDVAICPKLSNVNPAAFVKAKKQDFNERISERQREIEAEARRQQKGPSAMERIIRLAKRKSAEREAASANVIALPKRQETHSTPQIAAALDAATQPKERFTPKPLDQKAAELHAAIQREAETRGKSNVVHLDPDAGLTPAARKFKWAVELEERIRAGEELDQETALKLVRYQATSEYRANMDMKGSFGLEAALTSAV